jgi:hypothetical protein
MEKSYNIFNSEQIHFIHCSIIKTNFANHNYGKVLFTSSKNIWKFNSIYKLNAMHHKTTWRKCQAIDIAIYWQKQNANHYYFRVRKACFCRFVFIIKLYTFYETRSFFVCWWLLVFSNFLKQFWQTFIYL